jgi:hypothetical protein
MDSNTIPDRLWNTNIRNSTDTTTIEIVASGAKSAFPSRRFSSLRDALRTRGYCKGKRSATANANTD